MKVKIQIICMVVAWIFVGCSLVYTNREKIYGFINNILDTEYSLDELTMEQKVEDFEEFYLTITESVPFLDEVKDLYGIDFVNRKEYYLNEIKKTTSNIAYYGVMKAIATDICSFHTDICFPMYSNLQGLNCYNSEDTVNKLGMKEKVDVWWDEIGNSVAEYDNVNLLSVIYVDGKYIVEDVPEQYKDMANYELVSIDGISAEQYVVENISIFDLYYDYQLNQPYRDRWIFNDTMGEEVEVVWKDLTGEEVVQTLRVDKGAEVVWGYGYLYEDNSVVDSEPDVTMMRDDKHQLEYIKINNFGNDSGEELKQYLLETEYEKIVIDLRENYGGLTKYAVKYLFPALYDEDVEFVYRWKTPDTDANKKMNSKLGVKISYYEEKKQGEYYYKDKVIYNGAQQKQKDVYYLIGSGTGSAADGYIAMVKDNKLGTIVGTNTGGEGLGASYICNALKNSNLIYVYYPSIPINSEKNYNYCCGTAPDIYITQTREDYNLKQELRKEETASEYDKQLQYDTALKWIIEQ